jgi:hypothetical protein
VADRDGYSDSSLDDPYISIVLWQKKKEKEFTTLGLNTVRATAVLPDLRFAISGHGQGLLN